MAVDAAEPTKVVLVQDDVRLSQMTWFTATTAETAKAAEPAIEVKSKANVWNTRSKSTTLSAPRVTSTKHVVGYRGVLIFISQLALFPTFSIVSSHLDKLGDDPTFTVDPIMKSVAASIGPLGLCLVASLLEKLDKTARESAAAQMANVCGILACTLGLLFDQLPEAVRANPAAVWTGIMFLTGLSDISPFINKARACYALLAKRDTAPALPIRAPTTRSVPTRTARSFPARRRPVATASPSGSFGSRAPSTWSSTCSAPAQLASSAACCATRVACSSSSASR